MNQEMKEISVSIEQAKQSIKLKDTLIRLQKNEDFKYLIEEVYFKDEPARLAFLRGDDGLTDDQQKGVIKQLDAIGGLQAFFNKVYALGKMAERGLEEDRQTRDELEAEEGVEDNV